MAATASLAAVRQKLIRHADVASLRAIGLDAEEVSLAAYMPANPSGREAPPLAVVRPRSTEDIVAVIGWARKNGTALTTFSSSSGARLRGATVERPTVFVDLSGMNHLLQIDQQDAVAVIEPGVTFGNIDALLAPQGLRAFKPLLPRASKSVLTSYLDREPNLQSSEQWDVLDPFGGAQLVFGTGDVFRTGSAAISGTLDEHWKAGLRYLTAMGPAGTDFLRVVQGSQGTLAILNWAAILCERLPAREEARFVGADSIAPLAKLSAELHRRRIGMASFVASNLHLAAVLESEPDRIADLASRLPAYTLYIQLTASCDFPNDKIAYQLADVTELCADAGLMASPDLAGHSASRIAELQANPPASNYKDRIAGAHRSVFFLSQMDRAEQFIALARERGGADVAIYVQPRLHGRNCHVELVLPFDPASIEQTSAADALADELAKACSAAGGFFSRPYGAWADMAFARNPTVKPLLRETKSIFDPDRILNPGRLCF
jgi:FAD/FMN-containing dehydrogenase